MARLVLLDFDGTLTRRDSLGAFLQYVAPGLRALWPGLLSLPWVLGYQLGWVSASRAKAALLQRFLRGRDAATVQALGARFANEVLPGLMRPEVPQLIARHRAQGARLLVVSASPELWLGPWCASEGLELLCTGMVLRAEGFTGVLDPPNCQGPEKARRIHAYLDLGAYDEIWAYGDSAGDREMLALAQVRHYRHLALPMA